MAAGLGFKDFVTGEVLTAADVDGYLMQGVWVFASAAARDAAVTSPQEGNFAYLKDTNVTTYYTGSAWANLDTTGMTNPMTTTGDTIYSSSGSTPARLGIGSTGQVLTVAAGVPSWATASSGSLTLLSTTTASGSSTTVSSISTAYTNLQIKLTDVYGSSATSSMDLRFNSDSSDAYDGGFIYPIGTTSSTPFVGFRAANQHQIGQITAGTSGRDKAQAIINIYDYNSTGSKFLTSSLYVNTNSGSQSSMWLTAGNYVGGSGITSLTLLTNGGTYSGGTIQIYGVK
jgi:hypothetical protein